MLIPRTSSTISALMHKCAALLYCISFTPINVETIQTTNVFFFSHLFCLFMNIQEVVGKLTGYWFLLAVYDGPVLMYVLSLAGQRELEFLGHSCIR